MSQTKYRLMPQGRSTLTKLVLALSLVSLPLVVGCQQEPQPQSSTSTTQPEYSYSLDLDLGEISLESNPQTVALEGEANAQSPRSLDIRVNQDRVPTLIVSPDTDASGQELARSPFPVYVVLRSATQTVYGRATWWLVRAADGSMRVRAQGTLNLNAEPNVTGLSEGDDQTWHLYAYYATGSDSWDGTSRTITFKQRFRPKRLYNNGTVLRLGRDLDVPFSLGYKDSSGRRINGIPMRYTGKTASGEARFDMKQIAGSTAGETVAVPATFRMLGSLYSIRLRNAMNRTETWAGTATDQYFLGQGKYRPTYDYSLRGFYLESTVSSDEGKIDLTRLAGVAAGSATPWQPLRSVSRNAPIRIDLPLTDSVHLDRGTTTATLLFWLKDFDESATISSSTANIGEGLGVWADLYNKTIIRHVGMTQVLHSERAHRSGYAYRSTLALSDELRLNPLARMGYDYIAGNPVTAGQVTSTWFALNAAENGMEPTATTPGAGKSYTYRELRDFSNLIFNVYYPQVRPDGNLNNVNIIQSTLRWQVPDQYDLWSVFPTMGWDRSGITLSGRAGWIAGNTMRVVNNEDVRLDGWRQPQLSVYYRRDRYNYGFQSRHRARNTFYALRFVGTPYMIAYRYTERGKWYNPNSATPLPDRIAADEAWKNSGAYPNPDSRLIIEGKSLGHLRHRITNASTAQAYLRDVIATDDFWGDRVDEEQFYWTSTERSRGEIIARVLHVNGNPRQTSAKYIGGQLYIWSRIREDNHTTLAGNRGVGGVLHDQLMPNNSLEWIPANAFHIGTFGRPTSFAANVLPWLSVNQEEPL